MDIPTDRDNDMMEQHQRECCNCKQDVCVGLLLPAEFMDNHSIHYPTLMAAFWANHNYHPMMQFKSPMDPSFGPQVQAALWIAGMLETHRIVGETITEDCMLQTKYNSGIEMTLAVGAKVKLSTGNLNTSRPSKMVDYKHTGLYTVRKIINRNVHKLDWPSTMRDNNIVHVLLLDHYTMLIRGHTSAESHPVIVQELEEWEVHRIVDCLQCD